MSSWSQEEIDYVLTKHKEQCTPTQIAAGLPLRTPDAVVRKLKRLGHTPNYTGPVERVAQVEPGEWPLPIRPVNVVLPARKKAAVSPLQYTSVHYSDVHFPHHDPRALDILYQVVEDLNPQRVVCHGDLLDCTQISRFEKDPQHRVSLQEEITMAAKHLAMVSSLAPGAEKILILGNHEDRLRRLIWEMAKQVPSHQLIQLPGVWQALEWKNLLGLDALGWRLVEGKEIMNDRLILKHGDVVRKWSGYSARGEWEKYGKGGVSGHVHRMASFYHRDHNGVVGWWELGCMCDLNPSYVPDPDWQQGFLVTTWNDRRFGAEQVLIHEGSAIFRGKVYEATQPDHQTDDRAA